MSDADPRLGDETEWAEVRDDRLCDRYEFLLKAGQSMPVADFLRAEGVDPAARPELLRELARLEAYFRPGDETRTDPCRVAAAVAEGDVVAGMVIGGRYTLVRRIGQGGMGHGSCRPNPVS